MVGAGTEFRLTLTLLANTIQNAIHSLVNSHNYIHARWLIFTFPGQNEPRPGHGTPWVNSGTIPAMAIPGRLATLLAI